VLRARLERADAADAGGGEGKVRRMLDGGAVAGSLEDEMNRKCANSLRPQQKKFDADDSVVTHKHGAPDEQLYHIAIERT
jgi:hypothetical protein